MDLDKIKEGWCKCVYKLNTYGIPLPMVRSPTTRRGDVALTLVVFSSFLVMVGIVGKWSKVAGSIDIDNALEFFYASISLYFGRMFGKYGKEASSSSALDPKKEQPARVDSPD